MNIRLREDLETVILIVAAFGALYLLCAIVAPKASVTAHDISPKDLEEMELIKVTSEDGSASFSIKVKEIRAMRRAVRILLAERMADLESQLFVAKGGITAGTIRPRQIHLLQELVAELQGLQNELSVREKGAK